MYFLMFLPLILLVLFSENLFTKKNNYESETREKIIKSFENSFNYKGLKLLKIRSDIKYTLSNLEKYKNTENEFDIFNNKGFYKVNKTIVEILGDENSLLNYFLNNPRRYQDNFGEYKVYYQEIVNKNIDYLISRLEKEYTKCLRSLTDDELNYKIIEFYHKHNLPIEKMYLKY